MDENRGWNKRRREYFARELIVCRIFIQYSFRVRLRGSFMEI